MKKKMFCLLAALLFAFAAGNAAYAQDGTGNMNGEDVVWDVPGDMDGIDPPPTLDETLRDMAILMANMSERLDRLESVTDILLQERTGSNQPGSNVMDGSACGRVCKCSIAVHPPIVHHRNSSYYSRLGSYYSRLGDYYSRLGNHYSRYRCNCACGCW